MYLKKMLETTRREIDRLERLVSPLEERKTVRLNTIKWARDKYNEQCDAEQEALLQEYKRQVGAHNIELGQARDTLTVLERMQITSDPKPLTDAVFTVLSNMVGIDHEGYPTHLLATMIPTTLMLPNEDAIVYRSRLYRALTNDPRFCTDEKGFITLAKRMSAPAPKLIRTRAPRSVVAADEQTIINLLQLRGSLTVTEIRTTLSMERRKAQRTLTMMVRNGRLNRYEHGGIFHYAALGVTNFIKVSGPSVITPATL